MLEYGEWGEKRSQVFEIGVVFMKKLNDYGQNVKS